MGNKRLMDLCTLSLMLCDVCYSVCVNVWIRVACVLKISAMQWPTSQPVMSGCFCRPHTQERSEGKVLGVYGFGTGQEEDRRDIELKEVSLRCSRSEREGNDIRSEAGNLKCEELLDEQHCRGVSLHFGSKRTILSKLNWLTN